MTKNTIYSASGCRLEELNFNSIQKGEINAEDFRIGAERLLYQADVAKEAGYSKLAVNLHIAAELVSISNQEVLDIYTALRPGRSTYQELFSLAEQLERERNASLTADFIRQAAEVYLERGIIQER